MSLKILHLPTSVGGNSWGMACGEREIGLESDVLITENNWLRYPCDISLGIENAKNRFEKLYKLLKCFISIKGKYDIYHFNSGSSLLDFQHLGLDLLDLPFYGKNSKIFVTYNGCDARQKYATINKYELSACQRAGCYNGKCNDYKVEIKKQKRIKKFAGYADGLFSVNPDLLTFLPSNSKFLPYTIANWKYIEKHEINNKKIIHIVHAPTNRICKGSDYVLKALSKLKNIYGDIVKISLVENLSHVEALKIYSEADLIIDQLLIGWYGAFAVEAMKMGKPVMCFIREEDLQYIPLNMARDCLEAFINVNKDNIFDVLCNVVENRDILFQHAANGYEYVENYHNPIRIAESLYQYYQK